MLKMSPAGNGKVWFKISRKMFRKSCKDFFLMMKMMRKNNIGFFVEKKSIVLTHEIITQCMCDSSNNGKDFRIKIWSYWMTLPGVSFIIQA